MDNPTSLNGESWDRVPAITAISVEGFKSIYESQPVEIRPLTILAGANSSGKSSLMQPLLLLKQTLEAPFDPGPFLLNGPHVKFSNLEQMLSFRKNGMALEKMEFGFQFENDGEWNIQFGRGEDKSIKVFFSNYLINGVKRDLKFGDPVDFKSFLGEEAQIYRQKEYRIGCLRNFILGPVLLDHISKTIIEPKQNTTKPFEQAILNCIHVPGFRGVPSRTYPVSAVNGRFTGTFEHYVASIIESWKKNEPRLIHELSNDLRSLGLASGIEAKRIDDSQLEIKIPRLPGSLENKNDDWVSIADVGFGVSQTLPVVVSLLAAKPGQLVYIEQPELHLHPRAQHSMGKILAKAAQRGVQVVVETHSSILLLGIQSLVAKNELDPTIVKLHWFQRNPDTGSTQISSADLDVSGSFGDWPEDFDDVSLQAQREYLDAAESHLIS